jgi:hypothetical protein
VRPVAIMKGPFVTKQTAAPPDGATSPVVKVPRSKLGPTEVMLVAKAGGRCEFRGCNEFLYEHALTGEAGNFAENAHIVAFHEGGPRGAGDRPAEIDGIDNLMLLCRRDHKLIDDNPGQYKREELQAHKREHEARIRRVTGLGPSMQTTVLAFTAMIGTFKPVIGRAEISDALLPRYPGDSFHILDLTSLGIEEPGALYEVACRRIIQHVDALHAIDGPLQATRHLSVLGLAPIPMLVFLGHAIGNKVATDFFQCHRDKPERWTWYEGEDVARFEVTQIKRGPDPARVALVLPLSGPITADTIPSAINETSRSTKSVWSDGHPRRASCGSVMTLRASASPTAACWRAFGANIRGSANCMYFPPFRLRSRWRAALTSCRRSIRPW